MSEQENSTGQDNAVNDPIRQQRDRLIEAMLPHVPFDGWTMDALIMAAQDLEIDVAEARRHFAGGQRDLIAWHSSMADRRMLLALQDMDLPGMKIRERIRTGVLTRLSQNEEHKDAIRKALSFLTLPTNAVLASKLLYRTVDDIWFAAGDNATDWNFYTKRGLLAGVYSSTLLFWLSDQSEGHKDTEAFLDRRIDNVMQVPKITGKLTKACGWLPRRFGALKAFRAGARSEGGRGSQLAR